MKYGCSFCIRIFEKEEIEEWCDEGETPICPHCGIDALIEGETNKDVLVARCEKDFCGIVPFETGKMIDALVKGV